MGISAQYGKACFDIGWVHIRDETPAEATAKTFWSGQLPGMPVGAQHDLFALVVKSIERMEELLNQLLLAFQELDVVEKEDVHVAIAILE